MSVRQSMAKYKNTTVNFNEPTDPTPPSLKSLARGYPRALAYSCGRFIYSVRPVTVRIKAHKEYAHAAA